MNGEEFTRAFRMRGYESHGLNDRLIMDFEVEYKVTKKGIILRGQYNGSIETGDILITWEKLLKNIPKSELRLLKSSIKSCRKSDLI